MENMGKKLYILFTSSEKEKEKKTFVK